VRLDFSILTVLRVRLYNNNNNNNSDVRKHVSLWRSINTLTYGYRWGHILVQQLGAYDRAIYAYRQVTCRWRSTNERSAVVHWRTFCNRSRTIFFRSHLNVHYPIVLWSLGDRDRSDTIDRRSFYDCSCSWRG